MPISAPPQSVVTGCLLLCIGVLLLDRLNHRFHGGGGGALPHGPPHRPPPPPPLPASSGNNLQQYGAHDIPTPLKCAVPQITRHEELPPLMPELWCTPASLERQRATIPALGTVEREACNSCDLGILASWGRMLREHNVASTPRARPLFWNVGANIGNYALHILSQVATARVTSFELMPNVFTKLKETWTSKPEYQSRWNVVHLGMAAFAANVTVWAQQDATSQLGGIGAGPTWKHLGNSPLRFDNVPVSTVADYILTHLDPDEEIDLLHIDAEGFDPAVLWGAHLPYLSHRIHAFTFEYGGTWFDERQGNMRLRFTDFVRYPITLGYRCFLIGNHDLFPVDTGMMDGSLHVGSAVLGPDWAASSNFICTNMRSPYYTLLPKYHRSAVEHCHLQH